MPRAVTVSGRETAMAYADGSASGQRYRPTLFRLQQTELGSIADLVHGQQRPPRYRTPAHLRLVAVDRAGGDAHLAGREVDADVLGLPGVAHELVARQSDELEAPVLIAERIAGQRGAPA